MNTDNNKIEITDTSLKMERVMEGLMEFSLSMKARGLYGPEHPFTFEVEYRPNREFEHVAIVNIEDKYGCQIGLCGYFKTFEEFLENIEWLLKKTTEDCLAGEKMREAKRKKQLAPKNQLKPFLTPRQEVGSGIKQTGYKVVCQE